ncbi:MAG: metal ABC transporter ATP-binding protein [Beijerinckiaceae bacterium]
MSQANVIRFENLTLGYGRRAAVHHLDGAVESGSLLAVVGPNGAGKSTLLKGVAGALKPLEGRIVLSGSKPSDVAYLPQIADLDRSFPMPVFDLVSAGAWNDTGLFGGFGKGRRKSIQDALAAVGLTGFENRTIGSLSGGQLQRALFARLLLQDARVILLDEPFTAIDARTTADLLALIQRWHGEKRTVIAVLHDMDVVKQHFPQTLLLARSPVAWGDTASTLHPENLLRARRMSEAHDPHAAVCQRVA